MLSTLAKAPLRIAILISGGGSNLQSIIDQIEAGLLHVKITMVVSDQADAYGLTRAKLASIPQCRLAAMKTEKRTDYDLRLQALIEREPVDLIVLAGFMRILSGPFVRHFAGKIINLHPSLLPNYKGLNTHVRVLQNKEPYHGASVHFVTAGLDEGPVIIQQSVAVSCDETADSLEAKVHSIEHTILPKAIKWISEGRVKLNNNTVTFYQSV